jgi:deoxycytidine triphosphate deaminase
MVIGPKELLRLVKKTKLVENLSDRELTNPEGAGFDIRIGKVFKLKGNGYLGVEERKTPDAVLVKEFTKAKVQKFVIKPGRHYIVSTIEKVNLPIDITANFWLRSTLYRSGIILSAGNVAPGYSGELSFTLFNSGPSNVTIELGARIIHILFYRVEGLGNNYRGQWQGGRVAATRKEKQV